MNMDHKLALHNANLDNRFATQFHEARTSCKDGSFITCTGPNADKAKRKSCGKMVKLSQAFKCLYCNFWFCQTCMEKHLGKTKKQYQKERLKKLNKI